MAAINLITGHLSGTKGGTAIITYSLGGGCIDTAVATILAVPNAGAIIGPLKLCIGASTLMTDTATGGTWSGTNMYTTVSSSGLVTGLAVGTDIISYTVAGPFCTGLATREITVKPLPDHGTISGSTPVCAGATELLNETISGGKWTTRSTAVATIDSATGAVTAIGTGVTTIVYTVSDTNGCVDSALFTLAVIPPPFTISSTIINELCYGSNNGSVQIQVTGTPPFEYNWSNGATTPSIDSVPTGTYSVSVTQPATQCKLTDSFTISQPDSIALSLEAIPDTCKLGRGSLMVTVLGGTTPYTYAWSDSTGIKGITATITALRAATYTFILTDVHNCTDTLKTILAEQPCHNIVIHDVITPNGDGANDKWVIEAIRLYPNNLVQIFDKWGDKVYEKQSYTDDWYGQDKNNTPLPDGTYYYIVKLNEENKTGEETEYSGTVLVKR